MPPNFCWSKICESYTITLKGTKIHNIKDIKIISITELQNFPLPLHRITIYRQMERVSASALRLVWRCFDTVSVDDT